MKRLAIILVMALAVTACSEASDDNGGTAPDSSDVASDVASDLGVVPDADSAVSVDVPAPDAVPDATPEVSVDVSPDSGSGAADGLLGSPCVENADCVANPEYTCFFGFCTERCSQDGTDLPGTCQNVSDASIFGDEWGCPADLVYCMPGLVQDKNIICSKDADCAGVQSGMICGAAVLVSSKIVDGICVPGAERAVVGEACSKNTDCMSLMCLGEDPENGEDGYCTSHCETNAQCLDGHLCTGIGFITEDDTDETSAWGGYCLDIGIDTEAGEELTYCTSQSKCPDGFHCNAFIEPSSLVAQTWCIPNGEGTAQVGEVCTVAADCMGGSCYWGEEIQEGTQGYCSWDCPGGLDDCGEGQVCVQRALHNNGTAENPLDDNKTIGACIFNGVGDACVLGEEWCEGPNECVHPEGWEDNYGQCMAPSPVCDDYCAAVEATCVDENAITWETDCATDCAGWPPGEPGDTDGNTAHCRFYHAQIAVGDPVLHCPHAAPDGGGKCVDIDLCADVVCDAPPADGCDGNTAMTYGAEGTCAEGVCSYTETSTDCGADVCTDGACAPPADPCADVVCDAPPADGCDGNTALTYSASGTCSEGVCSYTETSTDCGAEVCTDGACAPAGDPCADVVCDAPPVAGCDGNAALTYAASGTCSDGVCSYTETSTDCGSEDVCTEGACVAPVDPCADVVCDAPPADVCDGNTVMTYAAEGTCADGACSYTESSTDCGADVCTDGACLPVSAGPTYDDDVQPIYMEHCSDCHSGGNSGGTNFASSYAAAIQSANPPPAYCAGLTVAECTILRIEDGSMPTAGSILADLTNGELATIQAWIDADYPEN